MSSPYQFSNAFPCLAGIRVMLRLLVNLPEWPQSSIALKEMGEGKEYLSPLPDIKW